MTRASQAYRLATANAGAPTKDTEAKLYDFREGQKQQWLHEATMIADQRGITNETVRERFIDQYVATSVAINARRMESPEATRQQHQSDFTPPFANTGYSPIVL